MKAKTQSEILEFLTPYAESLNLEIVEVSFKMAKNPQLTIYIDKEGGVDLNTCEEFHNLIKLPSKSYWHTARSCTDDGTLPPKHSLYVIGSFIKSLLTISASFLYASIFPFS